MTATKTIILENNLLKVSNGNFVFTSNWKEFILIKIVYILQTVAGEDIQNITKGLNLQGIIFNNQITTSDIYAEIRRNLFLVPEVQDVPSIEITQDQETLKITCQVIINEQLEEFTINV